jgi:hypothetical protein
MQSGAGAACATTRLSSSVHGHTQRGSCRDLFFRDVPEGVACIVAGSYGSYTRPLAIIGGNCSVQARSSMILPHHPAAVGLWPGLVGESQMLGRSGACCAGKLQ